MKKLLIFGILVMAVVAIGCARNSEPVIGGDTDEHGCLVAAGYSWCEAKGKCLRTWEEGCPGNERYCTSDADCIPLPSECHPVQCINREFESNYERPQVCTEEFRMDAAYSPEDCVCQNNVCQNKNLGRTAEEYDRESQAREFCDDEHADSVYLCGSTIKVVSDLLGGGATYYREDMTEFSCPVVGPDDMSQECAEMMDADCSLVCRSIE